MPKLTVILTALLVATGLTVASLGIYIGAGVVERRIVLACIEHREARVGSMHVACELAPGWREDRR